jgi:hypothetical protein
MSKKKRTEHEATIVYKHKPGRPSGMTPQMYWYLKVDGDKIGKTTTLNAAADLLLEHGYKVWAWRRDFKKSGAPAWRATVIKEHNV